MGDAGPAVVRATGDSIGRALDALRQEALIIHPTETVASLSGDPFSERAVARARQIKGYQRPRPFLCLVLDIEAARSLARSWTEAAETLVGAFWPGPLTLIVDASERAPRWVLDGETIALRMAVDEISRALVTRFGRPIFSTSANRRGSPPHRDPRQAARALSGSPDSTCIALVLTDGAESLDGAPIPSSVVDVTGPVPRVVRPGAVTAGELTALIPEIAT